MGRSSKGVDRPAASGAEAPPPPPPETMSYEAAMEEAQAITDRLDRGEIGLEESLAAFRRGMELLKRCRVILDAAEQQVQQITAAEMPEHEAPGEHG